MTSDEITVYDKLGRAYSFDRKSWRAEVLPKLLAEAWDAPDELRVRVKAGLREGCANELLAAAERLVAIDDDVVAAACLYAEVQHQRGDDDAAKKALLDVRKRRPEDAEPVFGLARMARDKRDHTLEVELLAATLELDPNHEGALQRRLSLASTSEERESLLLAFENVPGAWFPGVQRARQLLDDGEVEAALARYRALLPILPREPRARTRVTGDLGECGRTREVVAWFADDFEVEAYGVYAGLNLVQALIAEGCIERADVLLDELFHVEAPQCAEHLAALDEELASLRRVASTTSGEKPTLQLALIDGPIWAHGLRETAGLLPPLTKASQSVLMLGLVDAFHRSDDAPQRGSDPRAFDTYARVLPLYLAEALRFITDVRPLVVLPGVPGFGPVTPRKAWDFEALREAVLEEGLPKVIIAGSLEREARLDGGSDGDESEGDNAVLVFHIHDVERRVLLDRFVVRCVVDLPRTMLEVEHELTDRLERLGMVRRRRRAGIWQRPRGDECRAYADAIDALIKQSLVSNHWLDRRALRDEARLYQGFFTLCELMPGARVPEAMLLRSLVEARRYGSRIARRYVEPMRAALAESLDRDALSALRSLDAMLDGLLED